MFFKQFDGYKEAWKVDFLINKYVENYPPDENNWLKWLNFTRTIRNSLDIIEKYITKVVK